MTANTIETTLTTSGELRGWGPVAVKVPADVAARADALIPDLQADPEIAGMLGRITRASVIRLALVRGLASLEGRASERKRIAGGKAGK